MPATKAKETGSNGFISATKGLLDEFQARRPLRTGSLVISIFGDAIAPHGGAVWLGSLINILRPFGVNQRLVRTSVFRLAKDGWLESEQVGRRSYYSLTAETMPASTYTVVRRENGAAPGASFCSQAWIPNTGTTCARN